jgi:hypothetical protein
MSEIESFARVWLSELQSGTRVVVGGISIEGAGQNEADKINAAFEKEVAVKRDYCLWGNNGTCWQSGCGKNWILGGTPEQKGMNYCFHCGKMLKKKGEK